VYHVTANTSSSHVRANYSPRLVTYAAKKD